MNGMNKTWLLFALIFFNSISFGQGSIVFKTEAECHIQLKGFRGLKGFTLADMMLQQGQQVIHDDFGYVGLGLIVFDGGQQFPLILNSDFIQVVIHVANTPPTITGSPENEWLYQILLEHQKTNNDLMSLENSLQSVYDEDPFRSAMTNARNQLEVKKKEQSETISQSSYPIAGTLLRARLLMESTYSITTMEILEEKKAEIFGFVKDNYGKLYYSDMLAELFNQYLMMEEFVFERKGSFEEAIIRSTNDWIENLNGLIEAKEVLSFAVTFYYNRSMVGYASVLMSAHPELVYKSDAKNLPECMQMVDFSRMDIAETGNPFFNNLSTLEGMKVLLLVKGNDVFSKVETIMLARMIFDQKVKCTMVIIPVDNNRQGCESMSKLFAGTFYFASSIPESCLISDQNTGFPVFILLDEKNQFLFTGRNALETISYFNNNIVCESSGFIKP